MAFGKKKNAAILAISNLQEDDSFKKQPEALAIFSRITGGRETFREALSKILKSVMEISKLQLALVEYPKDMERISQEVAAANSAITEAATEMSEDARQVMQEQEEFTNTITSCSENSSEVVDRIAAGQKELSLIRDLSESTSKKSHTMQEDMNRLHDVIENINSVIDGINSISAQTNLLALNASIEAARAGEAGKGFAVVADEIRNLAEETQNLTAKMAEFLQGIKEASDKSIESAGSTMEALDTMTEKIGSVWAINEENQKDLTSVNESISGLSAGSEEIASLMSELENKSSNIKQECHNLEGEVSRLHSVSIKLKNTTAPIGDIEGDMDDAAKLMGDMANDKFYEIGLEGYDKHITSAIGAHSGWLATLKEMVEGRSIIPLQSDSSKCGFGHFYYSVDPHESMGFKKIWRGLEEKHRHFHSFGTDAVKALMNEDYDRADAIYKEAEEYSKELLSDLNQIKTIIEEQIGE